MFTRLIELSTPFKFGRCRGGKHGVALFHSDSIEKFSYPPQIVYRSEEKNKKSGESGEKVRASDEEDFVELQLRSTEKATGDARLIIICAYLPFSREKASGAQKVMETTRLRAATPENRVVLVGDLNMEKINKTYYRNLMTQTGLQRTETPVTGKFGGKAQAIWTNDPEGVRNVEVWTEVTGLSDHHYPLSFTIPWRTNRKQITQARIRSFMRIIKDKAKYQFEINEVKRGPNGAERLKAVMLSNTSLPPVPHANKRERKRNLEHPKPLTKREQRQRMAKTRIHFDQRIRRYEKKLFSQAWTNGPMLKSAIMERHRPECEPSSRINFEFTEALQDMSWREEECDVAAYFAQFGERLMQLTHLVNATLTSDYTGLELHDNLKKFSQKKTYIDFEGKCLHLMGMQALEVLAEDFTQRTISDRQITRYILGIPTGKTHSESERKKILQKTFRPVGMGELLEAFYCHCQNVRMIPVMEAVAPEGMLGFIPHREGHDMILRILLCVEWANRTNRPFWCIQGDIEKHFDRLQHKAIEAFDELLDLATPFFGSIVRDIRNTTLHVRVDKGKPGRTKQESGGCQGDQRVPTISALILAPLVYALEREAAQVPTDMRDRMMHLLRFILNFVDDFVFGSESLRNAYERFKQAQRMCAHLKMNLKLVCVAGSNATTVIGPHRLEHEGKPVHLSDSMKILGACIHFKTNAKCAVRKCKSCPAMTELRICTECQEKILDKAFALPLPTLDKINTLNSRILSSLRYGVYTCEKQQRAWYLFGEKMRRRLQLSGYGGYRAATSLPAAVGGLGVENTEAILVTDTLGVLERALNRNESLRELIGKLASTGPPWPRSVMTALGATGPAANEVYLHRGQEEKITFAEVTVIPHRVLTEKAEDRRSQDHPVQIELIERKATHSEAYVVVATRSTSGPVQVQTVYEMRQHEKKWSVERQTEIHIRLLARIIEKEKLHSRRVTIKEAMDKDITKIVKEFIRDPTRIHRKERVYTSVLARTEILTLTNDDTLPRPFPERKETCYSIPDAFPITIQHKGNNFVTGASGPAVKNIFTTMQIEEYRKCRQILSIIPLNDEGLPPEIDHSASAVAAGTLRGVHYDTHLKTAEAEQLLRITCGALVRTPKTEEKVDWEFELTLPHHLQQERHIEILHGEACRLQMGTRGPRGMTAVCGAPLSLAHILSHVTEDDLLAATIKVNNESQIGPMKDFFRHPKYMAFGFIPQDLYKKQPPEKQKALKKQLRLAAATYARLGLHYYKLCTGKDPPPLSEFVVEKGEDVQQRYKYIARADYSCPAPKEGEPEGGPAVIGLGGYIALASEPTRILWKFQVRRVLPQRNSGLGEHLGNMVLSKMVLCTVKGDVCIGCDNRAVPNQHEGEFVVGNPAVRVARAKTATIKVHIEKHKDAWFPREQNKIADGLASQALTTEDYDKEWVKELDETLNDIQRQRWLSGWK